MISLKNVKKTIRNIDILSDITLSISSGDVYVICCEDGGGKTYKAYKWRDTL
ncbi:MAG: hypothetical protein MJ151_04790 [Lachnospiraceae bacterium]|nr:hypothetical protein [Lachnospiraceae bacterium]